MVEHVQTKTEIREILERLGVRPQKRFGQHFLIDGNLMRRLAETAELSSHDAALEVGGGTGGLTDLLAARAGRVAVVEIDRQFAAHLRDRFAGQEHVQIIETDVLANKNRLAAPVVAAVQQLTESVPGRTALVANLPYNVASPLLVDLLCELPAVTQMCFTVQKDVADRIEAAPGGKDYGPLSVVLQSVTEVRRIAHVPASAFWPVPQVESSMLSLTVARCPTVSDRPSVRSFSHLVRDAFHHRRKTLRFNLKRCLDERQMETAAGLLDLGRRPETLAVDEWLALFEAVGVGRGGE